MNGNAALTLLMLRLGNKTEATLRAACLTEMALLQDNELERGATLPFFLKHVDTTLQFVANTKTVALPDRFLREWDDEHPFARVDTSVSPNELIGLEKDDYDILIEKWGYFATGDYPEAYAIVGETMYLFPTPTTTGTLYGTYYRSDDAPTDTGTENKWLKYASDLLISRTGELIAGLHLGDTDLLQMFVKTTAEARKRLVTMEIAREEAGRRRSMGDD